MVRFHQHQQRKKRCRLVYLGSCLSSSVLVLLVWAIATRQQDEEMIRKQARVVTTNLMLADGRAVMANASTATTKTTTTDESSSTASASLKNATVQVALSPPLQLQQDELSDYLRDRNAGIVWDDLIRHASRLTVAEVSKQGGIPKVMEVGVHRPKQCLAAAVLGLEAHCVEPSPASFGLIQRTVQQHQEEVQGRIHLYQRAAADTTGRNVTFWSSGGTGDHVGGSTVDMWTMTKKSKAEEEEPAQPQTKGGQEVQVLTIRIDDLVKDNEHYFMIKVDTQGFEPAVFAGMERTIAQRQADYIVFEYWPKGMDFLLPNATAPCLAPTRLLQRLLRAGYRLYPLAVEAHPKAPAAALQHVRPDNEDRPFQNDLLKHCLWYYEMEKRFPSETYQMGYWSDVVAVAPGVTWLPDFEYGWTLQAKAKRRQRQEQLQQQQQR